MPMMAGPRVQYPVQRQVFNPLDINRDGKVNLKDLKAAKTAVVSRLDQDGDGDFDFKDIQKLADNLIAGNKKTCSKCGKKLKKKSKYLSSFRQFLAIISYFLEILGHFGSLMAKYH